MLCSVFSTHFGINFSANVVKLGHLSIIFNEPHFWTILYSYLPKHQICYHRPPLQYFSCNQEQLACFSLDECLCLPYKVNTQLSLFICSRTEKQKWRKLKSQNNYVVLLVRKFWLASKRNAVFFLRRYVQAELISDAKISLFMPSQFRFLRSCLFWIGNIPFESWYETFWKESKLHAQRNRCL